MKIQFSYKPIILIVVIALTFISGCNSTPQVTKTGSAILASADGSPISYGVNGQGDTTIVFVHCWTCNHKFWTPQIEFFSNDYKVVWVDLAAHGKSGSERENYTVAAFGQDVVAVVNEVGGNKIVLVGHSMGGPVAVEAAKVIGDQVVGVVGVDTFYTPFKYPTDEKTVAAFIKPFETDFIKTSGQMVRSMFTADAKAETIESIVESMAKADPKMAISAMYNVFRWYANEGPKELEKLGSNLKNINAAPTGKEEALHNSVILIPGAGHFIPQVQPDKFNSALDEIITNFQQNE